MACETKLSHYGSTIFDYIEVFYNRVRRHSHLGGVSPEAFSKASP
nr:MULTISPECIES: IS3 family transposase [unclassified Serratia (in: enterobacteria)]